MTVIARLSPECCQSSLGPKAVLTPSACAGQSPARHGVKWRGSEPEPEAGQHLVAVEPGADVKAEIGLVI